MIMFYQFLVAKYLLIDLNKFKSINILTLCQLIVTSSAKQCKAQVVSY